MTLNIMPSAATFLLGRRPQYSAAYSSSPYHIYVSYTPQIQHYKKWFFRHPSKPHCPLLFSSSVNGTSIHTVGQARTQGITATPAYLCIRQLLHPVDLYILKLLLKPSTSPHDLC